MDTTNESIALRNAAGVWYLLTPPMLAKAKVDDRQQAELTKRFRDDTAGFGLYAAPFAMIEIGRTGPGRQLAAGPGNRGLKASRWNGTGEAVEKTVAELGGFTTERIA